MLLNKKIPVTFFFQKVRKEFLIIIVYSTVLCLVDQYQSLKEIEIPLAIPSILGTVISLLLAFRTAQAYDRWWEARIVWGAIVNDSRTLIRQILEFYKKGIDQDGFINDFVYRQVAWCYSLGEKLRGSPKPETLEKYFDRKQILEMQKYNNLPNHILSLHASELKKAYESQLLNDFQQIQIDNTITRLCDSMGKSERIKTTVFPRTYSLVLHFLIYVFATILPFGLNRNLASNSHPLLIEIALVALITSMFLLIERISFFMQDPFENKPTDIAVTAISEKIEIDLLQMIGENPAMPVKDNNLYYEM